MPSCFVTTSLIGGGAGRSIADRAEHSCRKVRSLGQRLRGKHHVTATAVSDMPLVACLCIFVPMLLEIIYFLLLFSVRMFLPRWVLTMNMSVCVWERVGTLTCRT